jgi:hypothetical protein
MQNAFQIFGKFCNILISWTNQVRLAGNPDTVTTSIFADVQKTELPNSTIKA